MDPGQAFGKVLRIVRKEVGLTQEEVAHAAGVDRTFVSMIERGERQPTVRVLFQLAGALNVQPVRLIELTQELVAQDPSDIP